VRTILLPLLLLTALAGGAYWLHATPGRGSPASFSLLTGAALGILMQRGRFCFFCIFRDLIEFRNSGPFYSILAALVAGSIGYAVVFGQFLPNPGTGRLPPGAHIGPVSWVLVGGGVAFGIGMALSGACISGHLYRLGEGYSRAPIALIGSMAGFGLGFYTWNSLYLATIHEAPTPWLPAWLGYGGALLLTLGVIGVLALLLLRYVHLPTDKGVENGSTPLQSGERALTLADVHRILLGQRWNGLVTGALVGIVGVFAYFRVEPLGVTAQLGSVPRTLLANTNLLPERLIGLDTLAGCATMVVQTITDNGLLVSGLVVASLAAALASRRFQISRLTWTNSGTALLGGILMGWGAMVSLGCTVGVLLSGVSAFALSGWVFFAAVFAGVWAGIRLGLHRTG